MRERRPHADEWATCCSIGLLAEDIGLPYAEMVCSNNHRLIGGKDPMHRVVTV